MADVKETNVTTETTTTESPVVETTTPSVDELMKQLEAERAEKERLKGANDKLSKSEAEIKRQLRAKLTVEEQEAEERRLADEQRQQEYENALSELNKMKAQQAYASTLSDEKTIENIISAVSDSDHKAIALIIENEKKSAVKVAQAEWMKSRPQPNTGGAYSGMSSEQIMAIPNREERKKAIAANLDKF